METLYARTLRFRGSLANAIANAAIERESTYGDDNEQEEYQPRTRTEIINHLTQLRDQPWPLHRRIQRKKELNKRLTRSKSTASLILPVCGKFTAIKSPREKSPPSVHPEENSPCR
ncbi:hypothetical protein SK128_008938 [Halocaridina rubra]|uniref:Uncharacterized protein n=1 Tax=Halocaridina rubra TaxID=373956 RepID=A0AAN8X9J0_HALRR